MEQTAGPVDRRTGKAIPAPGHLKEMSPMLARIIGCATVSRSLPSPPFTPPCSMTVDSTVFIDRRNGSPYSCPPQAHPMNACYSQMVGRQAEMTPPYSHSSRTSSCSTISATFFPEAAHPCLRDSPTLPGTPSTSQLASISSRASAPDSSSTSATLHQPSSAKSNQYNFYNSTPLISGFFFLMFLI